MLYDPLLVHYLAEELDERLRGRACAATPIFMAERQVLLPLGNGEALRLDLHPRRGWVTLIEWRGESEILDAVCEGVAAAADERRLSVRLRADDRFRARSARLVIELHSNQWNALLVSGDERILSVLWARRAGRRTLRAGQIYTPPAGEPRFGANEIGEAEAWEHWREVLGEMEPSARRAALIAGFAYTGTANADAILNGAAADPGQPSLRGAFERWWRLRSFPAPAPVLLQLNGRLLPYPVELPGVPSEPAASLLEAMLRAAKETGEPAPRGVPSSATALIRSRVDAARRRVDRLLDQRSSEAEIARLRSRGDLLLARKRLVPRGATEARVRDWEGNLTEITLDPALSIAENAARWYDEAKRRERANEQLPGLIEAAQGEAARWSAALEAAERGAPPEWALESLQEKTDEQGTVAGSSSYPYRRYRTSGGLEVRVGRSARENDRLTFAHSAPDDIWLHARSVSGSHVILRWQGSEGSPPARDLAEAAALAAFFSKARSSALVPVDWTRRKYVRKPRGAPPGSVVPQRLRTLFVEPDPRVEEKLRAD